MAHRSQADIKFAGHRAQAHASGDKALERFAIDASARRVLVVVGRS